MYLHNVERMHLNSSSTFHGDNSRCLHPTGSKAHPRIKWSTYRVLIEQESQKLMTPVSLTLHSSWDNDGLVVGSFRFDGRPVRIALARLISCGYSFAARVGKPTLNLPEECPHVIVRWLHIAVGRGIFTHLLKDADQPRRAMPGRTEMRQP